MSLRHQGALLAAFAVTSLKSEAFNHLKTNIYWKMDILTNNSGCSNLTEAKTHPDHKYMTSYPSEENKLFIYITGSLLKSVW